MRILNRENGHSVWVRAQKTHIGSRNFKTFAVLTQQPFSVGWETRAGYQKDNDSYWPQVRKSDAHSYDIL